MTTIFPKHPHIKGCDAVVLEVRSAPPGERLPAASQVHAARGGYLDRSPRGLARVAIGVPLEVVKTYGR